MTAFRWCGWVCLLSLSACAAPTPAAAKAADPARDAARADAIYRDQLAVQGRDPRFSTDRQVAELRRAIALYGQFIERAEHDPEFGEAVKRSRARIKDAEETIAFLLSGADAEAKP